MKINLKNIAVYSLVLFCSLKTSIYSITYNNRTIIIKYIIFLILVVMGISFFVYKLKLNKVNLKSIFMTIISFLNKCPFVLGSLYGILINLVTNYFLLDKDTFLRKKAYKILFNFLFILSLLSILEYLYYQLGGNINFIIGTNYKINFGVCYFIGVFNSYLVNIETGNILNRLLSIYDEPGYFGTFLGIFILFLKNDSRFKKIIIYLAGFLTLSTAFIYFFIMKIIIEGFEIKKILKSVFILFIIINLSYFYSEKNITFRNNVVLKIERIVENKNLNRLSKGESWKKIEEFKKNGNLLLGERKSFENDGGLSIWMKIYEIGYLGVLIEILLFLNIARFFNLKNKKSKIFILIALSSIFQRPNILDLTTLICMYCAPTNYDEIVE
ncbi:MULTISPECIES: hypothetical protein [Fusobacterium]|uniref:hypothetical protein n=1 Tax=Fusobacterium TaxID=848 RepID=UPI001476AA45|nr:MULTISPECIES: hypothetical protein [Fusobacterium]NME35817.1 hypothetical protein [Fusobacterium sp. FSA-380-WT-3A]